MVAMIMMRTLHRDISKYNQLETAEEAQEETGWKLVGRALQPSSWTRQSAKCCGADVHVLCLHPGCVQVGVSVLPCCTRHAVGGSLLQVHGDVFRPPTYGSWLAVLVGTGVQLFSMTLVTMVFATLGFLSPANRGGLMTAVLLLFVFMGCFAGYFSARLYKTFKVRRECKAALTMRWRGVLSWLSDSGLSACCQTAARAARLTTNSCRARSGSRPPCAPHWSSPALCRLSS
jgi:transmembrane 9 superfamily protein 2/4